MAVRLLSRRDHSVLELEQKLLQRKYPLEEINAAICCCIEKDWLNDQRFAMTLLNMGIAKGHGWRRICHDAKRKGIGISLLEKAESANPQDWFELANLLAKKRFGDASGKLPDADIKQRAKWFRYLQYRGFSYDEIDYALSDKT